MYVDDLAYKVGGANSSRIEEISSSPQGLPRCIDTRYLSIDSTTVHASCCVM